MQRDITTNDKSYLKHYLGGPAMANDEHHAAIGQIEQIDLEDGSVLIKSANESHWFDHSIVKPSLRRFEQLTIADIQTLVGSMSFKGRKIQVSEIVSIESVDGLSWVEQNDNYKAGVFIHLTDKSTIWINSNWSIAGLSGLDCSVDNIGQIIFILCDMDYDVT